jgi:amidase
VACELVDFALGTDTGGSVRVPASYCGLWGMRPSHDTVSLAGVMPFSPAFDTVGILARTGDVLVRAMSVLLESSPPRDAEKPAAIHIVVEALALCDPDVRQAIQRPMDGLRSIFGGVIRESSLKTLLADEEAADLSSWVDTFRLLRGAEVDSCLGAWVAATHPKFGPAPAAGFAIIQELDRTQVGQAVRRRESLSRQLQHALGARDLLCIPTAPTLAPIKGSASHDRHGDFYSRTLSLTSIAGIGRLPQVSMPLAEVGGVPVGMSLIAAHGEDSWLLETVCAIESDSLC